MGDGTVDNSDNGIVGVVGWRKLTNIGVLGHLRRFRRMGPFKRLVLGQYWELEAQTWLKLKLESSCIHCKHLEHLKVKIGDFLGRRKYNEVPKLRLVADGPHITATTYCPTPDFCLRLDHSGP